MPTPRPVPSPRLASHFRDHGIAHRKLEPLGLGFGPGQDQYALYEYPAPAPEETLGIFFDWHTKDFFSGTQAAHLAVGLRGPLPDDPHRGRGLAIGQFAAWAPNPDGANGKTALFDGCAPHPGGPALFIEEFTINEGTAPIVDWQMTPGVALPALADNGIYRVDLHVSFTNVWAGVWQVDGPADDVDSYRFLAQLSCDAAPPFSDGRQPPSARIHADDEHVGNAFVGNAFGEVDTRSQVESLVLAHWRHEGGIQTR